MCMTESAFIDLCYGVIDTFQIEGCEIGPKKRFHSLVTLYTPPAIASHIIHSVVELINQTCLSVYLSVT